MESIEVEQEEKTFRSLVDEHLEGINSETSDRRSAPEGLMDPVRTSVTGSPYDDPTDEETGGGDSSTSKSNADSEAFAESRTEDERREETSDEDEDVEGKEEEEDQSEGQQECDLQPGHEKSEESEEKLSAQSRERPAPPSSLVLSGPKSIKKKVLVAPALSLSLGGSLASEDFAPGFLSPSPEDDDDPRLDLDLDAMETPSDSESLHFPNYDLDLEDDLRRLGVASHKPFGSGSGSLPDQTGLSALGKEDVVDSKGTRWRCFSTGDPPQESRVNMTVLEPFLRVLSHGGYHGDGMDDIVVFSSCYLPENHLENYQYVMDNLFRFVVGTLELMVAENYVIVYLCSGSQKDKLPGIGWLRDWYTTIDRRLRKNLKGFYVVHPTWYIKALITIIKPFISSKFSRKLQFVDSLQELSQLIPTEHVQIPEGVRQYDQSLSR
uniref:CRAL-TRIO domain-containing protein n=1 Tax=Oryzias latipes TaxID=8090 RepID=A0A3P9ICP4_ORYLA